MTRYEPKTIESKWNELWYKFNVYEAVDFDNRPKKYILAELPYPSGKALHAGHMIRFTVPDIYSRYLRMKGYNVLFPIGWDSFGLPAENYAIKTGTHPAKLISDTVVHYKESIRRIGYGVDWKRVIDTSDPKYYKWTQWIFLKFFKAGLAKYKEMPIWWCENLKTVLSDEEVLTDKKGNKISERGEQPVVRKMFKQWILDIKKYADKLLEGLDTVEYPESIKTAQRNWVGKSEGEIVKFKIVDFDLEVFTTRADTIFGVTFLALAPEHPLVDSLLDLVQNKPEVENYIIKTKNQSDLERTASREKTGVLLDGIYATNPANTREKIPVYLADYVVMDYGKGAIMGVPAHDRRDFEFAKKFGIKIVQVIDSDKNDPSSYLPTVDYGTLINSGRYNGLASKEAISKIVTDLKLQGAANFTTTYKIRDWVFSRQRYWGEPIPLIHKANGEIESVCDPDDPNEVNKKLPLTLPDVPDYRPTSDGLSPLEKNKAWVAVNDSQGNPAKRETNTMPNWAGSCWYYIRYIDPQNENRFADPDKLKYWLPVDRYFGGAEHTTMHLLYSRFWHKFLYDNGLVPTKEPYAWRLNGGLLLGPDGRKMSKSFGNVIEPIEIIDKFGADALRMFICFLGPYEDTYPWNDYGVKATFKLIRTIYDLKDKVSQDATTDEATNKMLHKLIKNVTQMTEDLKMNTCVSEFMIFVNHIKKLESVDKNLWRDFVKLLAPFAPFIAEELWQEANAYPDFCKENSVHVASWPEFDTRAAEYKVTEIPVQINGKVRAQVEVGDSDTQETVTAKLYQIEKLKPYLGSGQIKKLVYVPNKIINVVN